VIVLRCRVCGESIKTLYMQKRSGYSEKLADKPCSKCTGKVTTVEAKLLDAIFGGPSWD
jgi:hypothetical protein